VGAEAREPIAERDGRGMPPRTVFVVNVRNQLKKKEIGESRGVCKHIERKDLREFSGGREGNGVPEDSQEAAC